MVQAIKKDAKSRMNGSVENLKKEFSGLRTGRAHPSMLDGITVDCYGAMTPMNAVGSVSIPESRLLSVSVWDSNLVASVEKAIRESDLGLNPVSEGNIIRIAVPELTEERRKDIAKVASQYAEQARVSVRNIRRDAINSIKKSELPEDEERRESDEIQKITDEHIKLIDIALSEKEKELMQI